MEKYICFLRGINVGGSKKIKMADLRSHLSALNFNNLQTYIQSGNIIFEAEGYTIEDLETKINQLIRKKYGFEVPALILTPKEIEQVLAENPFIKNKNNQPDRMYFTFLSNLPDQKLIEDLQKTDFDPEKFLISGKTIFFYVPDGLGRSKLNNNFFENKLKVAGTTRNLKTLLKMFELSNA